MRVMVIGADGFIAKNLIVTLENIILGKDRSYQVPKKLFLYKYSRYMGRERLHEFCKDCDFIFYLAGVNRSNKVKEFEEGNVEFLRCVLEELESQNNRCPIMYASSIQAELDNNYGKSKKRGEELLLKYSEEKNILVYIYRLANVFGKWSRPDYNSVVATFCYNIARNRPIRIENPERVLQLIYIDDVVEELISLLSKRQELNINNPLYIKNVYEITLRELADMLFELRECTENKRIPDIRDKSLSQRLYSMYLTYVPEEQLKHSLVMKQDERGSFTELFGMDEKGQFSVNITKPGITKGEHWHHTKHEKFIVVSGEGIIQIRNINEEKIFNFNVSGRKIEIVDIPAGYTHNIINTGNNDLVTLMWANEKFNRRKPDTYSLKVKEEKEDQGCIN